MEPGRVSDLRKDYSLFIYKSYEWKMVAHNEIIVSYHFQIGSFHFKPQSIINFSLKNENLQGQYKNLESIIFNVGIMESISYWKATCSPTIHIEAGKLSENQILFWRNLFIEGLGEFYFKNDIDFTCDNFINITTNNNSEIFPLNTEKTISDSFLLTFGGGKDSVVTLDFLSKRYSNVYGFAINPSRLTIDILESSNLKGYFYINRKLDPLLITLNQKGFLNGHTPFSGIIGLWATLPSLIFKIRYIVVSNEASSNHANTHYKNYEINHQYAKSYSFEKKLNQYLKSFINPNIHYFSILRPFNELQISSIFSELKRYHPLFISCNVEYKNGKWCGHCFKCYSTYILLKPFLSDNELLKIFKRDISKQEEFNSALVKLQDKDGVRPFDCIPSAEEVEAAIGIINKDKGKIKIVLSILLSRNIDHLVPRKIYNLLDSLFYIRLKDVIPLSNILIFGFGLEGRSTLDYLTSNYGNLDITVLDENTTSANNVTIIKNNIRTTSNASEINFKSYNIIFKTPGISPFRGEFDPINYSEQVVTSNTNLFFEICKGIMIGITGTKGKSTTTSLIFHVLKGYQKVYLGGNIGIPCLDLIRFNNEHNIFVIELSASQLYSINRSPHIAVVLGIHPDHLDYFKKYSTYKDAKSKIIKSQSNQDIVIFNEDSPEAFQIAKKSFAKKIPFTKARPELLKMIKNPLIGEFNYYNIWPAIIIAKHYNINIDNISIAISNFKPLENRLEQVAKKDNILFISDIRSTTPEVACAAIEAINELNGKLESIFLGGNDRKQNYKKLIPTLIASTIKNIILLPPNGNQIKRVLSTDQTLSNRVNFYSPKNFEEGMRHVFDNSQYELSICLLSTAAPSNGGFFEGPEDKVRQFTYWAKKLSRSNTQ